MKECQSIPKDPARSEVTSGDSGQSVKSLLVSLVPSSPSVSPPPSLRSRRSLRSSGYETRVKWKGTETKEPGKERRSGG